MYKDIKILFTKYVRWLQKNLGYELYMNELYDDIIYRDIKQHMTIYKLVETQTIKGMNL